MNRLVIFTSSFPYGKKETYIETEIKYLSKHFDEVVIYPHYYNNGDTSKREVFSNVIVETPALPIKKSKRILKSFQGISFRGLRFFLKDLLKTKGYRSLINLESWTLTLVDYFATISSSQFRSLRELNDSTFYFYWGNGWAYTLLNFKNAGISPKRIFMRLHGSEAYLERSNGYIPLRRCLFEKVDFLIPISDHLGRYINEVFSVSKGKIKVSRLGVEMPSHHLAKEDSSITRIVSCSNVIELKRIEKIIEALVILDGMPIEWIHFGDGPLFDKINSLVQEANFSTIAVKLEGRVANTCVGEFYKNNFIDAFVNVSEYEGVPVSIMEAMAYGIPCIATDAGATRELVNNETGVLLENDFDMKDFLSSLKKLKTKEWVQKRKGAFEKVNSSYNAEVNYSSQCILLDSKC